MPRGPRDTVSRAIRLLMAKPLRTPDLAEALGITRRGAEKVLAALKRTGWDIRTETRKIHEKWHRIVA